MTSMSQCHFELLLCNIVNFLGGQHVQASGVDKVGAGGTTQTFLGRALGS